MRNLPLVLIALGMTIVGSCTYLASGLSGIKDSLGVVTEHLSGTPTRIVYSKDTKLTTGTLSKTLSDGTVVTMDYTWDGTAEDWRRIWALWEIICANSPPGGTAAAPGKSDEAK